MVSPTTNLFGHVQISRPMTMKKEGIQSRNRKSKNDKLSRRSRHHRDGMDVSADSRSLDQDDRTEPDAIKPQTMLESSSFYSGGSNRYGVPSGLIRPYPDYYSYYNAPNVAGDTGVQSPQNTASGYTPNFNICLPIL